MAYLEYGMLLEHMLDTRHLVLGLALCELRRLRAAAEHRTVTREVWFVGELLRIL